MADANRPPVATASEIIIEARSFAQMLASVQLWLQDGEGPYQWEAYLASPFRKSPEEWLAEIPSPSRGAVNRTSRGAVNRILWVRCLENKFRAKSPQIPNLVIQA